MKDIYDALYKRALGFTGDDGKYYPPETKALQMLLEMNKDETDTISYLPLDETIEEMKKAIEYGQEIIKKYETGEYTEDYEN